MSKVETKLRSLLENHLDKLYYGDSIKPYYMDAFIAPYIVTRYSIFSGQDKSERNDFEIRIYCYPVLGYYHIWKSINGTEVFDANVHLVYDNESPEDNVTKLYDQLYSEREKAPIETLTNDIKEEVIQDDEIALWFDGLTQDHKYELRIDSYAGSYNTLGEAEKDAIAEAYFIAKDKKTEGEIWGTENETAAKGKQVLENVDFGNSADLFSKELESAIKNIFPESMVYVRVRPFLGEEGIDLYFTLGKDSTEYSSGISANDFAKTTALIYGVNKDHTLKSILEVNGVQGQSFSVKPNVDDPREKYLAFGRVKTGWRDFKGTPEQVFVRLVTHFERLKDLIKENKSKLTDYGLKLVESKGYAAKGKKVNENVRSFRYLNIEETTSGLVLSLNKKGIAEVKNSRKEKKSDSYIWAELFDDVQGNSELIFHDDIGESGFGMTGAEGITDGYYYEGEDVHNLYKTDYPESAKVYWFPNYQVKNPLSEMLQNGSVLFDDADKAAKGKKVSDTIKFYDIPSLIPDLEFDGDRSDMRLHSRETYYFGNDNEADYKKTTKAIDDILAKGNGWEIYCWYDVSGFDYWMVRMKEQQYIMTTIVFTKENINKSEIPKIKLVLDSVLSTVDSIANHNNFDPYGTDLDTAAKGKKVSNKDSRSSVIDREDFNANNLSGEWIDGVYVVKSYGYYPVYVYKDGKWYENANRYSSSTAKQMTQSRPTSDTKKLSTDELKGLYEGMAAKGKKVEIKYPTERLPVNEQSIEERELEIFINNEYQLQKQNDYIIKNLVNKIAKGNFDINLAPKLYMYLVVEGIKQYTKQYGGMTLTKAQKENLSKEFVNTFLREASLGNYENESYLQKQYLSHGGYLMGRSHAEGGIDVQSPNGIIEVEGGEVIINKKAVKENCELLSEINQSAGDGVAFDCECDETEIAAKGKMIPFRYSNLYFVGTGMDANGNKTVKVNFPNQKSFSIQTNGNLPLTHSLSNSELKDLFTEVNVNKNYNKALKLAPVELEIANYIKEHGSEKQKNSIKIYAAKGKQISNENSNSSYYLKVNSSKTSDYDVELLDGNNKVIWDLDSSGLTELITNNFLRTKPNNDLNDLSNYLSSNGIIPKNSTIYLYTKEKNKNKPFNFKKSISEKEPSSLGGWHKDLSQSERRKLAFESRDKSTSKYEKNLSAARALQALSNVTKDAKTKKISKSDSNYFFDTAKSIKPKTAAVGKKIDNQYQGKNITAIWNAWTPNQRRHFLSDHKGQINKFYAKDHTNTKLKVENWYSNRYDELPQAIKDALNIHITEGQYAKGTKIENKYSKEFKEVLDLGYEQYYIRDFGTVETDKKGKINLVVVASIIDLEEYVSESELPEDGNYQLNITLVPYGKFLSKDKKKQANDDNNSVGGSDEINIVNYMGGLNYNPQGDNVHFNTEEEAKEFLLSKKLNDKINTDAILAGFILDKSYNRLGQSNWEYLAYMTGESEKFAGGGYVKKYAKKGTKIKQTKRGLHNDSKFKAEHAGKRTSEEGNVYYEYRKNRTDSDRRRKLSNGGPVTESRIDEALKGYLSAILFTGVDDDDTPLDQNYFTEDFDKKFVSDSRSRIKKYYDNHKNAINKSGLSDDYIGIDIWFTQSGQGAGFFDHSLDYDVEKELTESVKSSGFKEHISPFVVNGKVILE